MRFQCDLLAAVHIEGMLWCGVTAEQGAAAGSLTVHTLFKPAVCSSMRCEL